MEVSNPRDDRAERNRGSAEVPLSTVIPRVGNFHLEQNTILDSLSCTTTPKIWFISRFCVFFFSLGENTWVRCNFITQAKSVAISVWCARMTRPTNDPQWSLFRIVPLVPSLFHSVLFRSKKRLTETTQGRNDPDSAACQATSEPVCMVEILTPLAVANF